MTTIARRIVLRLDPARPHDGALLAAMRIAKAFHAELAARMISDTRFAGTALSGVDRSVRHAETSLRRELAGLGARENAIWTFEVVQCAGVLSREYETAADDIVAIELPRVEFAVADLREEIAAALNRARGVILFPATERASKGPIVVIVGDLERAATLNDHATQIAQALNVPLRVFEHTGTIEPLDIATTVRKLGATLAIADPADPLIATFLSRPRLVRELGTPLLLLNG